MSAAEDLEKRRFRTGAWEGSRGGCGLLRWEVLGCGRDGVGAVPGRNSGALPCRVEAMPGCGVWGISPVSWPPKTCPVDVKRGPLCALVGLPFGFDPRAPRGGNPGRGCDRVETLPEPSACVLVPRGGRVDPRRCPNPGPAADAGVVIGPSEAGRRARTASEMLGRVDVTCLGCRGASPSEPELSACEIVPRDCTYRRDCAGGAARTFKAAATDDAAAPGASSPSGGIGKCRGGLA